MGIIFGAGINGDQPSKYLKDRLDAGILLYKANRINKILLSDNNSRTISYDINNGWSSNKQVWGKEYPAGADLKKLLLT